MRYATNLSVVKFPDYTMVSIRNPWDTLKILHTYLLTDKTQPVPENLPEGTVVRVPLERAVVYSVVHGSVLKELGQAKVSRVSVIWNISRCRRYRMDAGVEKL